MPEQLPKGHELRPLLPQIGRKRMPQAVAAGRDARSVRLPLDLLWDGFDRPRTAGPLLIPDDHFTGPMTRTLR